MNYYVIVIDTIGGVQFETEYSLISEQILQKLKWKKYKFAINKIIFYKNVHACLWACTYVYLY